MSRRTMHEWLDALGSTLKKTGRSEWNGPCPACGGTDRFRVNDKGAFCRRGCTLPELTRAAGLSTGADGDRGHWFDRNRPVEYRNPNPDPERLALAKELWAACADPTDTPAHAYLCDERCVWPPSGGGFPPLPTTVGWLEADAVRSWRRTGWPGLPDEAAGAVVFAYQQPGEARVCAVSLEALTSDGRRMHERWRRTFGRRRGARFVASEGDGKRLTVCEGEVSALACVWLYPGAGAWALGGTSGLSTFNLPAGVDVLANVDGDSEGFAAATALVKRGIAAVETNAPGDDAADRWATTWLERAGILEFERGLRRQTADRTAWGMVLRGEL